MVGKRDKVSSTLKEGTAYMFMQVFRVQAISPLDTQWEDRDIEMLKAAGRLSDFHGAGVCPRGKGKRIHEWTVGTQENAEALRVKLSTIPDVEAIVWEFR